MNHRRQRSGAAFSERDCTLEGIAQDWAPEDPEAFGTDLQRQVQEASTEVKFAVFGATGSGKSTLVRALCGIQEQAYEHDPRTREEASFVAQKTSLSGRPYTIRVWDSPELQNGAEKLRRECGGHIDVLLYCIDVSATRGVVNEMVPGIREVTQALGPDVWRHAIVVLTFANILEERIIDNPTSDMESDRDTDSKYVSFISQWKKNICRALQRAGVERQVAREVPLEPAGHYMSLHLPGQHNWLGDLWLKFLGRARDEAKLAIFITNQHRIREAKSVTAGAILTELRAGGEIPIVVEDRNDVRRAANLWIRLGVYGATTLVGACVGGAGVVAGKTALIGLGVKVALGTAVVVGAGVGAGVGLVVGIVAFALHNRWKKDKKKEE